MFENKLAIALCRVSSDEQLKNNSLSRQRTSILNGAKRLGVTIPDDGWWSGRQSSKKGTNLKRDDIQAMLLYCKRNRSVKFLLIDRPDRFMRSVKEAIYFEVEFEQLGVKVWYTKDWDLNKEKLSAQFMKFSKYFDAEGSNDDRIEQSLGGALTALKEGRYPFPPKAAYLRTMTPGLHDVDPIRGPALKRVLKSLAGMQCTPTQALKTLNNSDFIKEGMKPYKMDKFTRVCLDPFYAGVVECDKQVKYRNENGIHEPLITLSEHFRLVDIFTKKPKYQSGPLKNGNPKYPLDNILSCAKCANKKYGRFVGFDHSNGRGKTVWEKYRCRSCGKYFKRVEIHDSVEKLISTYSLSDTSKELFLESLEDVWNLERNDVMQNVSRLEAKVSYLESSIRKKALASIDPSNEVIKDELISSVESDKYEKDELLQEIESLNKKSQNDYYAFLEFASSFVNNLATNFFELSKPERLRCKQLLFPSGFHVDESGKVYTN